MSSNWTEIVIFIAQNHTKMTSTDMYSQNKYLQSALFSQVPLMSSDPTAIMGQGAQVASFLQSYRSNLPQSTIEVMKKHIDSTMKLGQSKMQSNMIKMLFWSRSRIDR